MKRIELKIQIMSPWVVEKLNYRAKANSVIFIDYNKLVEKIFNEFETDKEFDLFRFKLCLVCRDYVKIKQYQNWYRLESKEIDITTNCLANCLPKKIRTKYFYYDKFYERYQLKNNLDFYYL
jgi:hypothetical protein